MTGNDPGIGLVEVVRELGSQLISHPPVGDHRADGSSIGADVLGVHLHCRAPAGAGDLISRLPASLDHVAVALGTGLSNEAEAAEMLDELERLSSVERRQVSLWTRRGSIGCRIPWLLGELERGRNISLTVDLPSLYASHEVALGPAGQWLPAAAELAKHCDTIVTGAGTAERVEVPAQPDWRHPGTLAAHGMARFEQRQLARRLRGSTPHTPRQVQRHSIEP